MQVVRKHLKYSFTKGEIVVVYIYRAPYLKFAHYPLFRFKPMRQVSKGLQVLYQHPLEFLGFQVEQQLSLLVMSTLWTRKKGKHP
jgi:hypothetical protein